MLTAKSNGSIDWQILVNSRYAIFVTQTPINSTTSNIWITPYNPPKIDFWVIDKCLIILSSAMDSHRTCSISNLKAVLTQFTKAHTLPMTEKLWRITSRKQLNMMTSSSGNIFRVTGLLCGEFTYHRWSPRTKASNVELWCFRLSAPE